MAITTNGKVSITNLQVGSSADLAGIISDESGTGVLAFTTSPTFTTPTLGTASATAIELGHASDTTIARASAGVVNIEGVPIVTTTATQTLTNKTLTSPVLGGTTSTASGNLAVLPATYILEVQGGASTEGAIQLNCAVNSHGQKIKSQPHSESATNTLLLPGGTTIGNSDAVLVSNTGTQTLTNKTLSGAVLSGTLTAGGSVGTAGQVLTSTGSGVQYATPSAGTTANDQAFAFAVQVFA